MQKDIYIFIGPPGAGKGSLSQLCIKNLGWVELINREFVPSAYY